MNSFKNITIDTDSLSEIRALSASEKRRLLVHGEPGQRIRAAWALGLANPPDLSEVMREATASESVPGVRRHFIVVLAGLGEVDVIASLARHDTDDRVRSTAARYVAAFANEHPDLIHVCDELLAADDDLVEEALFTGFPTELLPRYRRQLLAGVKSNVVAVRAAAFERLLGFDDVDDLVLRMAVEEENARLRHRVARVAAERLGVAAILEAAGDRRLAVISDLRAAGVSNLPVVLETRAAREGELVEYGFFDAPN